MPDLRRVHRFRDHPIAGVNWRRTRFVDEVHRSRYCSLCHVIPKRTVLLPCDHALCDSCHAANSYGCSGQCPLDQEPFEEEECTSCDFTTRRANALKVHCWNEARGCEFVGTMEFMLRHHDDECTFHTVECSRCGGEVLHRELSTHYVAGCSAAVSSTRTENTPSESQAQTLQDVAAALEELKTLLRDANHEHLLLALQSQMNELIEQIRNQESRPTANTHDDAARATSEVAQASATSFFTSLQGGTSRQDTTEEASTSSTSRSRLRKKSRRPKTKTIVDLPRDIMQAMRRTSWQDYPQHEIADSEAKCYLLLTSALSTTVTWREVHGSVAYALKVETKFGIGIYVELTLADITVLHTRDAYFTVYAYLGFHDFCVEIVFHGMTGDSKCSAPVFNVMAYNEKLADSVRMDSSEMPCDCNRDPGFWIHFHRRYSADADDMEKRGFLEDNQINIGIELCRQ